MRCLRLCTCIALTLAIPRAEGQTRSWTTSADFEDAELTNHTRGVSDQLEINSDERNILPYLWVACTERNTIVRIATDTVDPITQRSNVQPGRLSANLPGGAHA